MTNETAADRLAKVDSLLKDTYAHFRALKDERNSTPASEMKRTSFDIKTGKIRALAMVLDAFAEAGFEIDKEGA